MEWFSNESSVLAVFDTLALDQVLELESATQQIGKISSQNCQNLLFVPTKELANWAYFRRDSGSEQFREAARRVVNLRARHEGRTSPLSGE